MDTVEMEKARRDAGIPDSDEEGEGEGEADAGAEGEAVKEEDQDEAEEEIEGVEGEETLKPKIEKTKRKPRVSAAQLASLNTSVTTLDPALITKLRLTKKYYTDALRFINQLESAIPTQCQLLVSTTKTEVLETMRFFRTAYEYNLAGAEVGIKTMLHLIWTKDNNSTGNVEEGMDNRGVRGVMVEIYRSLYFDVVPDLSGKQQVNRIAKNMIE